MYENQREYQKAMTHYLKAYNILLVRLGVGHPNAQIVFKNMKKAYAGEHMPFLFGQIFSDLAISEKLMYRSLKILTLTESAKV